MKRYSILFLIFAFACGVISCSENESDTTTPNEETNGSTEVTKEPQPEPEPEEESAESKTRKELATNLMSMMSSFADTVSTIRDKESAESAVTKFDEIATEFEALASKMEKVGAPTGKQIKEFSALFSKTEEELQEKMQPVLGFLLGDEEVGKILSPAFQSFGERMEKLNPIIEKWGANGGESDEPDAATPIVEDELIPAPIPEESP